MFDHAEFGHLHTGPISDPNMDADSTAGEWWAEELEEGSNSNAMGRPAAELEAEMQGAMQGEMQGEMQGGMQGALQGEMQEFESVSIADFPSEEEKPPSALAAERTGCSCDGGGVMRLGHSTDFPSAFHQQDQLQTRSQTEAMSHRYASRCHEQQGRSDASIELTVRDGRACAPSGGIVPLTVL